MTHRTEAPKAAPVSTETALALARTADEAFSFGLSTTTLRQIVGVTNDLTKGIRVLCEAGLPTDPVEAAEQRREIAKLLACAPGPKALVMSQHTYMHALARVLRRHVAQFLGRQHGLTEEDCIRMAYPRLANAPAVPSYFLSSRLQVADTALQRSA